jgi:4-hydroxy-2-oxoheptanedioate aldolase
MTGKEFIKKLRSGEYLFGTRITSSLPPWTKLPQELNLDFVFIDGEHCSLTSREIALLCQINYSAGIVPMVRIPEPNPIYASLAIDWGALSIVAPYVEDVEQVIKLVGAVKCKPLKGKVLQDGLIYNQWNPKTKEYLEQHNKEHSLIINIESVPALNNMDKLFSVKGLDGVLIGPHDLSISLGIPEQYEHPLFYESIEKIVNTARLHGLGAGIHTRWKVKSDQKWLKIGLNLIVHIEDYEAAKFKFIDDLTIMKNSKK